MDSMARCELNNILRCQVVNDQHGWVGIHAPKGTRNVVLAVVTWEYGDDDVGEQVR